MNSIAFVLLLAFALTSALPEPPAPFLDEPLEGQRLEPELLSKVRDLLISDSFGSGKTGLNNDVTQHSRSSSSYGAPPPPSNSYGAPDGIASGGGFSGKNSFPSTSSLSNGNFEGLNGARRSSSAAGDITLSDPELAPLLATFELSPTVQRRAGPSATRPNSGFEGAQSAGGYRKQSSGGY